MGPLKGTRGSPFPQNAAGGETDRKKIPGNGKRAGCRAERRESWSQEGAGGATAVSPPWTATKGDAALPGTPHPQGRRLEPAPSPSELLMGVFSSGAAVLELTPAGNVASPWLGQGAPGPGLRRNKTRPRTQL